MKKQQYIDSLIKYEITAITKGGEAPPAVKVNPKKKHSKNNTIIGWNIYKNKSYQFCLLKEQKP